MAALLCHLYDISKNIVPVLLMCPNQPLFQWQRTHQDQAMYLLVETTPKVGHSTNCIVLQHCFVHKCLSAFLSTTHAHYSYMFTSMQQIYLCPCLSFLQIHTCTDLILAVTTCVAASDVLGTMDWESVVSIPSLTVSVLAVAQRSSDTICKYFKILYAII